MSPNPLIEIQRRLERDHPCTLCGARGAHFCTGTPISDEARKPWKFSDVDDSHR